MSEENDSDEDIFDTDPIPSSIILIYDNRSTECRCVKIVLEILKLEFQVKLYDRESNEFNLKSLNPREKLPILIDGQFSIAESRAIACYLCNQYESNDHFEKLYPVDAKTRAQVDQILYTSAIVEGMINSYLNIGGVAYRGERIRSHNLKEVKKALEIVEGFLEKNGNIFLVEHHFTLADMFMAPPILILELLDKEIRTELLTEFLEIKKWIDIVKKYPNYKEIIENSTNETISAYLTCLKYQHRGILPFH